ncbi:MAG: hypothetical protein IJ074_04730 [Clostridia bacterium]|nr:hypothetical protein [Clostridia bacterium]
MLLTEYNEVKQMELVREEGREEGREEERTALWQLIMRLIEMGRNEDVTRAANDAEYREQLYREFHIV